MSAEPCSGKRRLADEVGEAVRRVRREVVFERSLKRKGRGFDESSSEGEEELRPHGKRCVREQVEVKVARALTRLSGAFGVPEELVESRVAAALDESLDDLERRLEPELRKLDAKKRPRCDHDEEGASAKPSRPELTEHAAASLVARVTSLEGLLATALEEKRAAAYAFHQKDEELRRWRWLWEEEGRQRELAERRLALALKPPPLAAAWGGGFLDQPRFIH